MFGAILMMGGLGLVIGISLALASKIFYVYVDPKVLEIDDLLPGANCGGCGYPGCSANAEAIVAGESPPDSCVAGGADLAEAIAAVMGMSIEAKEPDIALPGCTYGLDQADIKYDYRGLSNCQAAAMLYGGMKVCHIGCLGLGSCMQACPFSAISMNEHSLPVVDQERCTGCGTCERVCPKHIIKLSSVTRRILKEYTTDDCTTPCQRQCPAGINISGYIEQVSLGNYSKAVQIIKERNPFPTVIGRICPRPCETACRRNLVDEPVAINYLKRYAADYEMENNQRSQPYTAPSTGRQVAIIGGGMEGLSAAFFSARLGHSPSVFEAEKQTGGLLRKAIAQYRLPSAVLQWDIAGVEDLGVKIKTNMTMGKDFTLASLLKEEHKAVLLASGGWDSRSGRGVKTGAEEPVPGVFLLIDLLRSGMDNKYKIQVSNDVVIAGGGTSAEKSVKLCRHLGAENISVIFRQSRRQAALTEEQIKRIEDTGASALFNTAITGLLGEEDRLESIKCEDLETGETRKIKAQKLFIDAGRLPETIFTRTDLPEEEGEMAAPDAPVRWQGIQPYRNPVYSEEKGLLSRGEPLTDYSAAIRAIAAGRRSAASIHKIMYELDLELPENVISGDSVIQSVGELEWVESSGRHIMPTCNPEDVPQRCPEAELGYSEQQARAEANRCLRCGVICYASKQHPEKMPSSRQAETS
ncbi:MAG: RnfABCDGE type electron transport complex subunit B [Desulfobacterales bacterium]|nr:RnfABCDGE type electron transport complex subunit B [Desulfobacterales bacterium]